MKNEITIYELFGLVKDNKAPYEVIYQGTKYYIDKLENYYRAEDRTPLFERIFNNYNDYDALQEKIEILSEENDRWEDIEEFEIAGCNVKIKIGDNETFIPTESLIIDYILAKENQLIKNQRKIIEKLEEK